jgi:RNA recognition motif-containing protein
MLSLKQNNYGFDENKLFNEFNTNKIQHGKKIYVGLFKKKDEYFKIKQDKEGKASNLYVKNFGNNFGDRDLFNLFKSFGSIKSAKVRRQKCGLIEKPLGCGFVDFENPEEAELARVALNGKTLPSGRVISVTYADCKSRRMRKKLEENCNLNNINNIINNNNNSNISSSSSNDEDDDNNSMILNQTISNNNNNNIENESPLILTDNLSQENEKFTFINTTNIYDYNNNNNENRFRSDSNSSETSFDLILTDWSERWNRQLHSEYRLFY